MKTVLCAINAKYSHSSLALRYMKKYNKEFDVEICEYSINDSVNNIYKCLLDKNASIYGFSCYIWNIELTLKVCEMLIKADNSITIFLGGPEAAYNADNLLKNDYIDYVMLGEGEQTLKDFLKYPESLNKVSGLAGKTFYNPYENPLDLSTVPLPYDSNDLKLLKNKIIYFETSRGCPFNCSYCLSSAQGKIRYFPIDYVKKGFDLFFKNNVSLVKLIDRTFNSDKKRAVEIIKYIMENSVNTRVHFEVAPSILDDEIISLLASAPKDMFQLEMGIQSCNEQTLKAINRNVNSNIVAENIKKVTAAKNMHIHLDLIAGLPFEDLSSFKKSFNYTYNLQPDMLQLGFLKVLYGTEIFKSNDISYCSFPPYEVISTKWLSANDVCTLKAVDNSVDKFYNCCSFKNTINKLYNGDAFDMFLELSTLIYDNKSYNKAMLYSLLYNKYGDCILDELTVDFLLNNKDTKLPEFIKITKPDNYKKICYRLLGNDDFLNEYNISNDLKQIRIESVNNKVLLVDYNKPMLYDITEKFNEVNNQWE